MAITQALEAAAPLHDAPTVISGLIKGIATYDTGQSTVVRDMAIRIVDMLLRHHSGQLQAAQSMMIQIAPVLLRPECTESALIAVTRVVQAYGEALTSSDATTLLNEAFLRAYRQKKGADIRNAAHRLATALISVPTPGVCQHAAHVLCNVLRGRDDLFMQPVQASRVSQRCDELMEDIEVLRHAAEKARGPCGRRLIRIMRPYSSTIQAVPRLQLRVVQVLCELLGPPRTEDAVLCDLLPDLHNQQTAVIVALLRFLQPVVHPVISSRLAATCVKLSTHRDNAVRLENAHLLESLAMIAIREDAELSLQRDVLAAVLAGYVD